MRRAAGFVLVLAVGPVAVGRVADAEPRRAPHRLRDIVTGTSTHDHGRAEPGPPTFGGSAGVPAAALAERWVSALWTHHPGDAPFGWLDRVADITAPDLEAGLRSARPSPDNLEAATATVEVLGVHPDANDAQTVTVVCVVRRTSATGRSEESCVTTVTMAFGADGRLVVSEFR